MVMVMVVLLRGRDSNAGAGPLGQSRRARYARLPGPAIAYSRLGTGRTPSAVPSSSNFPASHLRGFGARSDCSVLSSVFILRHLAEARRSRLDAWVSGEPCQLLFFGQARPSRRRMPCTREAQGRDFLPAKSLTAAQGVQKIMGYSKSNL